MPIRYQAPPFLLFLAFAWLQSASGQPQKDTTYSPAPAIANALASYHRIVGTAAGLFNGYEYANYPFKFEEGTAYFGGNDSVKGVVSYKGILYDEVFMKYDEIKDALVMWYRNDAIQLHSALVDRFIIRGHTFVHLLSDLHPANSETEFYELLYAGKTTAFMKTRKTIQQRTDATEGIIRRVDAKQVFLLHLHARYEIVAGKGDLIDALKDHKAQVRAFIRTNNLNWKNPADMIVRVAAYYDTL